MPKPNCVCGHDHIWHDGRRCEECCEEECECEKYVEAQPAGTEPV
jgi:hypothetical protein